MSDTPDGNQMVPVSLHREVMRPTTDRGRLAALATICSLAGVALGFALAGTMFASIPVAARVQPAYVQQVATPAWIGVGVRTSTRADEVHPGAWVRTVRPGSPAAALNNLRVNDVIVAVEGQPITTSDDLVAAVRSRVPGAVVELTVVRGTSSFETAVRLQSMPPSIWRIEQRNEAAQRAAARGR